VIRVALDAMGGDNAPAVEIEGDTTSLTPQTYGPFLRSLVHVFRNSVDHGIEAPDAHDAVLRYGPLEAVPAAFASSMLRTIELILGLQPMSQFDAAALRARGCDRRDRARSAQREIRTGAENPLTHGAISLAGRRRRDRQRCDLHQ